MRTMWPGLGNTKTIAATFKLRVDASVERRNNVRRAVVWDNETIEWIVAHGSRALLRRKMPNL